MSEYQPWIEKRAAELVKYMEGQAMTTNMLIEALIELCDQRNIDLEQYIKVEKEFAAWRKGVA